MPSLVYCDILVFLIYVYPASESTDQQTRLLLDGTVLNIKI